LIFSNTDHNNRLKKLQQQKRHKSKHTNKQINKTQTKRQTKKKRVCRYQSGVQNPAIEEEQTTQWPKEKGQTTIYKTHIELKIE
jgi:tRNA G10  N-methylase Trm11